MTHHLLAPTKVVAYAAYGHLFVWNVVKIGRMAAIFDLGITSVTKSRFFCINLFLTDNEIEYLTSLLFMLKPTAGGMAILEFSEIGKIGISAES